MIDIEEIKGKLGDFPVVRAGSHGEFHEVCRLFGLHPQQTASTLNMRRLEGARPTAIVYAPAWLDDPNWVRISQMMDYVVMKTRERPVVVYLDRSDLQ